MASDGTGSLDEGGAVGRRRKISIRTKLIFASGTLQEATVTIGGIATVLYYNQVLGVSPSLVGIAFLIVSIIDAVSDPIIGAWSDRMNHRWGRRHPFMLFSALPIAVAFFFLYQPVTSLSEMGLVIWLTFFLACMRLAQTFYLIPHDALGAELTSDYDDRTQIFGFNNIAEMVCSLAVAGIVLGLIFPTEEGGPNGLLNQDRYIILALFGAPTIFFSVLLCTLGTLDQIPHLPRVDQSEKFDFRAYFQEMGQLLGNSSYLAACLMMLTMFIGQGIIAVVANYAYIYVFDFSSGDMFWASAAKMPGVFMALPLLYFLSRHLEKREIVIFGTVLLAGFVTAPYHLRLLGWFPSNESPFILLAVFGPLFLSYLIWPTTYIVLDSQLADVADDHELRTGRRSEGAIFAIRSFGKKATQGIGGMIAGFGLEYINFPDNAQDVGVPPEAVQGLLILNGPVYLAIIGAGIMFMLRYKIDRARHVEILEELEHRRGE